MSRLKVEIREVKAYEVKINGESRGVFNRESSWNGLQNLTSRAESLIVSQPSDSDFGGFFGDLFSDPKPKEFCRVSLVSMSPSLLPADMREEKKAEQEQAEESRA